MLLRFIDSSVLNSGQRLDNVNKFFLVLTSGKLVLQKGIFKVLLNWPLNEGKWRKYLNQRTSGSAAKKIGPFLWQPKKAWAQSFKEDKTWCSQACKYKTLL